jgi:hypothetical protein
MDKQPNDQIMHPFSLGKTNRTAYQAFNPCPQPDMFALNFLCIVFTHPMLLGIEMALVSTPSIGVIPGLREAGKPEKVARCAAARKLLHIVWAGVKKDQPFDPNYAQG